MENRIAPENKNQFEKEMLVDAALKKIEAAEIRIRAIEEFLISKYGTEYIRPSEHEALTVEAKKAIVDYHDDELEAMESN